jgi:iron complex transport system substrate-binding protein
MALVSSRGPQRIACLSTEATEVLYRLGAGERIVGISGYTVYPPQARKEKPKISGFSTGHVDRILAVRPDLVIGFSDLQFPLLRECQAAGRPVLWFDQRTLAGIAEMVLTLGRLVSASDAARQLVSHLKSLQDAVAAAAKMLPRRPRVYFEEWDDPMICGIGWVSEMIALAGGTDVFAARAKASGARERIVSSDEVRCAEPELIIGSWCGKRFAPGRVRARPGWQDLDANLVEIKSADILSPGPVAIERGLPRVLAAIAECVDVPFASLDLPAEWLKPPAPKHAAEVSG